MATSSSHKIIIAGDFFPVDENMQAFCDGDIEFLLGEKLCTMFSDADFSICNVEGALTDHKERCMKTGPVKTAPTKAIQTYKNLGINCCTLANNHATDGGHQGLLDTMNTLSQAGIDFLGVGKDKDSIVKSAIYKIGDMKLGLYNVCETMYNKPTETRSGAWLYDEYVVCHDIENLSKHCDYLVVIYHGGVEKFPYPSPETKKRFHRMADSGANMVLSQHTHCMGSEEHYKGAYLLYGQGNFLLNNYAPGFTDTGLVIELCFEDGKANIKKHKLDAIGKRQVRYADNQDLSDFEERSSHIDDDEYIFKLFQKYCRAELHKYLKGFKSPGRIMKKAAPYFPDKFKKWLFSSAYSDRNLLFTLHTLRSEQNRETAIRGIEDLLEEKI